MQIPDYLTSLEQAFLVHSNSETALQMKKYMKDKFVFFGVKSPVRKQLYRVQKQQFGLIPIEKKVEIVKWCWGAPQREWQYFAMEFLGKEAKKVDEDVISLYEFIILNKSWWDTVDYIASNLVGSYLRKFPEQIAILTEKWMKSDNMWLQRTCLLFQLKYRQKTDVNLLENFIVRLSDSKEFFIRKAIGWSLREYSKTNPAYVKQFVARHQLSGLSKREALKWMTGKGI